MQNYFLKREKRKEKLFIVILVSEFNVFHSFLCVSAILNLLYT